MKSLAVLILAIGLSVVSFGQTDSQPLPTKQSIDAKKAKLLEVRSALESSKQTIAAQEVGLAKAKQQIAELEAQLLAARKLAEEQKAEVEDLFAEIPEDEELLAFWESPARKVVEVRAADLFVVDFNGTQRQVLLHGIYVNSLSSAELTKLFKKRLVKKTV
ncbi:MAG TPA: hypothetical protein VEF04_03380, partial [Blastocatellia bacterium]|nr:hypothetical protein [Blastocatellia bacterium]